MKAIGTGGVSAFSRWRLSFERRATSHRRCAARTRNQDSVRGAPTFTLQPQLHGSVTSTLSHPGPSQVRRLRRRCHLPASPRSNPPTCRGHRLRPRISPWARTTARLPIWVQLRKKTTPRLVTTTPGTSAGLRIWTLRRARRWATRPPRRRMIQATRQLRRGQVARNSSRGPRMT